MPDSSSRRLAAILFAGIAGYTALMQYDGQAARKNPPVSRWRWKRTGRCG